MWQSEPLRVFRMTMAVSMSPALPILASTRTLALATTSTGSSPSNQRARSKSWIIMSRNRPPETLMYSSGGGPGSRLVMTTSSTSPTSPLRIAAWIARLVGSKRRLKPMATGTRCFRRSARQRSTRLISRSIGFSHSTALPMRADAVMRSTWVFVEDATTTASSSGSARAAAGLGAVRAPSCRARSAAALDTGSTMYLTRALGCAATLRACSLPMRPAPKTQKFNVSFAMIDPPGVRNERRAGTPLLPMIENVLVDDQLRIDLAVEAGERVARGHFGHAHGALFREAGDMRAEEQVVELQQRIVGSRGLVDEDIEAGGADLS